MQDYSGSFLIYLARDNQNRILKEAGISQQLHQAHEQSETRAKGFAFATWLSDVMGLRSSKKLLG